jgi:hypothetical protein
MGRLQISMDGYGHAFRHHHMLTTCTQGHEPVQRLTTQGHGPMSTGGHINGFAKMDLTTLATSAFSTCRGPGQDNVIAFLHRLYTRPHHFNNTGPLMA